MVVVITKNVTSRWVKFELLDTGSLVWNNKSHRTYIDAFYAESSEESLENKWRHI
jgi:hypothetical protein